MSWDYGLSRPNKTHLTWRSLVISVYLESGLTNALHLMHNRLCDRSNIRGQQIAMIASAQRSSEQVFVTQMGKI